MKKSLWFICFLVFSMLTSCSKDEQNRDCNSTKNTPVQEINAPETAVVNQTVEIEVSFFLNNSCGSFSKFLAEGTERSRIVYIETNYEGCTCAQVIKSETRIYEFTPTETGTYMLKFQKTPDTLTEIKIEVTEG